MRGDSSPLDSGMGRAAGRGRGAFTHFLRKHGRAIDQYAKAIPATTPESRPIPPSVSGQFDDAVPGPRSVTFPQRGPGNRGPQADDTDWVKKWFDQVEGKSDGYGGDFDGDDDEEEEMGNLADVPFGEEIWWCKDAEEYENYKLWETAVDKQEEDQKHQLQARFDEMKREVLAQGGDVTKMELPDVVITTDLTFKAATGTATVDRAKPLPRPLETIVQSMQLPAGLDVTPNDPEYENVVNYWKTISKNNTLDERMKLQMITRIATFISKHRNNDAFRTAITVQDTSKKKKKRKSS
ncbi:unnamed protein product [Sphacelaria rigidula]